MHFTTSYSTYVWHFLFILSSRLYNDKYEEEQKGGGKGGNKWSDKCFAFISAM